jgi:hypothetical protein
MGGKINSLNKKSDQQNAQYYFLAIRSPMDHHQGTNQSNTA